MKISADKNSPDFHDAVHFIDVITIDGTPIKSCISVDMAKNEAVCYNLPLKVQNNAIMTHIVRGKIDIIWKQGGVMLAYLKKRLGGA